LLRLTQATGFIEGQMGRLREMLAFSKEWTAKVEQIVDVSHHPDSF